MLLLVCVQGQPNFPGSSLMFMTFFIKRKTTFYASIKFMLDKDLHLLRPSQDSAAVHVAVVLKAYVETISPSLFLFI